jgi:hypothetical protein
MTDICTAIAATTVYTVACFSQPACGPEVDGKIFCSPPEQRPCPQPPPVYECKRPDGSAYHWTPPPAPIMKEPG